MASQEREEKMNDILMLANLLFSETKDVDDAKGIAHVVKNRVARPDRFGGTMQEVIFAPSQFSGVNTNEWKKATSGKLTKDEENIYKRFLIISKGVLDGTIKDPTGGADHYVNLKLARPSWAKKMEKKIKIGQHTYLKE